MIEQHPTLPLVAVSGIDSTVKMFAPPTKPVVIHSFSRTHLKDTIIQDHHDAAARMRNRNPGFVGLSDLTVDQIMNNMVLRMRHGTDWEDVGETNVDQNIQQCATQ